MIPRLVTILVLCVAVIGVSWGMRAQAQNDTLEERFAALETQVAHVEAPLAAGSTAPHQLSSFSSQLSGTYNVNWDGALTSKW